MNNDMSKIMSESPLAKLVPVLDTAMDTVVDFLGNYFFGVLAVILWIRVVLTILNGRTSALLIGLALIFTLIAIAQNQQLW